MGDRDHKGSTECPECRPVLMKQVVRNGRTYVDAELAAVEFGVSTSTVRRECKHAMTLGRAFMYDLEHVRAHLNPTGRLLKKLSRSS